jgi:hypothetical protein
MLLRTQTSRGIYIQRLVLAAVLLAAGIALPAWGIYIRDWGFLPGLGYIVASALVFSVARKSRWLDGGER